jgi:hypothetical protein
MDNFSFCNDSLVERQEAEENIPGLLTYTKTAGKYYSSQKILLVSQNNYSSTN